MSFETIDEMLSMLAAPVNIAKEKNRIWLDVYCVFVLLANAEQQTPRMTKTKLGHVLALTESEVIYAIRQLAERKWITTVSSSKSRVWGGTVYQLDSQGMAAAAGECGWHTDIPPYLLESIEHNLARIREYPWGAGNLDRVRRPVVARALLFLDAQKNVPREVTPTVRKFV